MINNKKKKKKLSRYSVLSIIVLIIFGIITLRLIYLQIISYERYKEKADTTSTRFVSEKAPRGRIYDQAGNILADNKNTYTLTYTITDDATNNFYNTMKQIFQIFDENNEALQDTMMLRVDSDGNYYFEYSASDKASQDVQELRFKKDRGFDSEVKKELFKDEEQITDEQNSIIDEELLKITPEQTFYDMVKMYNIIELVVPDYNSKENKEKYNNMTGKEHFDIIADSGYSVEEIRKYMLIKDSLKMQSFKGYKSVTIADNIKRDTALIIYQKLNELPGIYVNLSPIRYYPYNNLGSAVIGYVSSINSSEEDRYELMGYDASTDLIGKAGIESAFEDVLKGVKGGTTVKVNSQGRTTEELFKLESYPGNNVHLTIDRDIQYAAEQALADGIQNIQQNGSDTDGYRFANATRGALVAVEVNTGRILSMVSYPGYDPNLFAVSGQLTAEENKQYFNPDLDTFGEELIERMKLNKSIDEIFPKDNGIRCDKYDLYPRPFYNYATMSLIPPGSTFKPLTAIAGLERGVIDTTSTINDKGKFDDHPETFGKGFAPECLVYTNYGYGHGAIDIKEAIQVSCNYFFYETAYRLFKQSGGTIDSLDSIAKYAYQFGLGIDPNSKEVPTTGIEIQENFGQTYNFTSFRKNSVYYAKFELVEYLENGDYKGIVTNFIPFDIRYNEDDNENVKNAKASIKEKMSNYLYTIGTNKGKTTFDEFAKDIKGDVETIINKSDTYKARVASYESENNKTVNLENEADIVTNIIARFTVNDKASEITSPAQLIYAAIGQGMHTFTPLQLSSYVSTIANGGTRYKLHLVDKVTDNDGNIIREYKPQVINKIDISQSTIDAVKEGMSKVNEEEGGTARAAFLGFPISTGGKTGTADFSNTQKEYGRSPYATYISFAPVEEPEIAVVAVVFDGGHGGSIASAVRAVYEAYFKDTLLEMDPNYAYKSASFQKYILGNPYLEENADENKEESTEEVEEENKENIESEANKEDDSTQ